MESIPLINGTPSRDDGKSFSAGGPSGYLSGRIIHQLQEVLEKNAVIFRVAEEFLKKSLTYYMLYIMRNSLQYSVVMGG